MAAGEVFRRSPEGQQALDSRDKRISARMRALMLFMCLLVPASCTSRLRNTFQYPFKKRNQQNM